MGANSDARPAGLERADAKTLADWVLCGAK